MIRFFVKHMDRIMFRVMPSCRHAMELQSQALDEKLPFGKRFWLFMHLTMCRYCQRYAEQIRWLHAKIHQLSERMDFERYREMPEAMRERLETRVRDWSSS